MFLVFHCQISRFIHELSFNKNDKPKILSVHIYLTTLYVEVVKYMKIKLFKDSFKKYAYQNTQKYAKKFEQKYV